MMFTVVLFPSSVQPVGVASHVLALAEELIKQNTKVLVLCPGKGWLDSELKKIGVSIQYIKTGPTIAGFFVGNISLYRSLRRISHPAVLHLHGRMPLFCSVLSRLMLRRVRQVCTVHQFHEASSSSRIDVKGKIEKILLKLQERIVAVSEGLRTEVAQRIKTNEASIILVHNFIPDIAKHKNQPTSGDASKLRIVTIGALSLVKGFDLAIRSLYLVREINCTLDIIGDGPQRSQLESLVREVGLEDRVTMLGIVPNASRVLQNYDLVLVPSRSESFGIVVLEAYRAGIPVIATNVKGLNEVAIRDAAMIVEPDSPEAIAEAIRLLASEPKLRINLANAGRRRYEENFKPDKPVRTLLSVYKRALDNT